MKFVFDYRETLERRVTIEAGSFVEAIASMNHRLETEQIVLGADDFAGAELRMPLSENYLPRLQEYGENVKDNDSLDILIDFW